MSEIYLARTGTGAPHFHAPVTQLVYPGLLLDLDGDGQRDVLGSEIVFHR